MKKSRSLLVTLVALLVGVPSISTSAPWDCTGIYCDPASTNIVNTTWGTCCQKYDLGAYAGCEPGGYCMTITGVNSGTSSVSPCRYGGSPYSTCNYHITYVNVTYTWANCYEDGNTGICQCNPSGGSSGNGTVPLATC